MRTKQVALIIEAYRHHGRWLWLVTMWQNVFPEDTPQEATSESTDLMLQDTPVF